MTTLPEENPEHAPVLGDEAVAALAISSGDVCVDGTFGGGGYTRRMLAAGAHVIAIDRDPTAIAAGNRNFANHSKELTFIETPFDGLATALPLIGHAQVDGVVFDFGVSSMHLDQSARGFSFMQDGPLDMRMGHGRTAAEFVNGAKTSDLADVIYQYGEERRARHLANLIVAARDEAPIETTAQLAAIAERALGKGGKIHAATRLFQALRIFVNDEIGQIVRALLACERLLRSGGHLVAVSFHSLEDRLVKRFFAATDGRSAGSRHEPVPDAVPGTFEVVGKAMSASPDEVARNPRARSARMRVGQRTDAALSEWPAERLSKLGVPPLVFSSLQREWAQSS